MSQTPEFLEFKHTVLNRLCRHRRDGNKDPLQLNERQSELAKKYLPTEDDIREATAKAASAK